MNDLQWNDALTGQVDRHGGNIFISNKGKVTGIDNDAAFGSKNSDSPDDLVSKGGLATVNKESHAKGLPSMIDHATAQKYRGLTAAAVRHELTGLLSDAEIDATVKRLQVMKDHIDQLEKDKKSCRRKRCRSSNLGQKYFQCGKEQHRQQLLGQVY